MYTTPRKAASPLRKMQIRRIFTIIARSTRRSRACTRVCGYTSSDVMQTTIVCMRCRYYNTTILWRRLRVRAPSRNRCDRRAREPYILSLASLALARPEAGYSYNQPSQPSGSYGAPGGGGSGFGGGCGGPGGGGPGCGGGGGGGGGLGGLGGGSGFGGLGGGLGGGSGGGFGGGSSFGGGSGGGFGGGSSFGGGGGGGTLIQKHIYVHVPPPEPEEQRPIRNYQPQAPAQKHYKIIFIKAPTPPAPTAPVIPQLAQDEQKTLIYVLVKKPEDAPEFTLPTQAPTQPSKPEVYFIKYKTQVSVLSPNNTSSTKNVCFPLLQKDGGGGGGLGGGYPSGGPGGLDGGLGGLDGGSGGLGGGHGGSGLGGGGGGAPSSNYGPPGQSGPY
ncbi:unnamed protein product [Trichogramma brassicae]|uniref:DUF243 domain-containing protein n=1 Tax=Trichogramma brassicae TaxID=86971 RepID=A0A6H5J331_9HYME|nr:unnamed protein product [Trichogramma brassicae]